jgi:hypothetical protein
MIPELDTIILDAYNWLNLWKVHAMELQKAKEILSYFSTLLTGYYSRSIQQKIKEIFVGFQDYQLTVAMYPMGYNINNFRILPTDKGKFTLCVAFHNGEMTSVKKLAEEDGIVSLSARLEELDYMPIYKPRTIELNTVLRN